MGLKHIASLLVASFSLVSAETPSGFIPQIDTSLGLQYNGNSVGQAGSLLPRSDVQQSPSITLDPSILSQAGTNTTRGIIVMMDLDVPRNGSRTTLLHWLAPDVDFSQQPPAITTTAGAPYAAPNPPAGDVAHRYIFVVFTQPDNFAIPPSFSSINPPTGGQARIGFDLASFAAQGGLTIPVAANYITVKSDQDGSSTFPPISSPTGGAGINGTVSMSSLASDASAPTSTVTSTRSSSRSTPTSVAAGNTTNGNDGTKQLAPVGLSFLGALLVLLT